MTSLFSATVSPAKGSSPSLHCRPSNKPPLRALYDLLIAPMEVVRVRLKMDAAASVAHPSLLIRLHVSL